MSDDSLIAEYELIRADGSLTTTRYLSIPDDVPGEEVRDWVADRIIPRAEEGGYAEWVQRVMTRAESAQNASARVDEVRRLSHQRERGQ
ncbi:hypothetical protein ACQP2Y_21305 [Actinoplanes sp. CA-051413]|uniref:hypothetical protein n=1 Tax=Actinoplanes sp. CA-051413 TaxID=3239899 RepID=UPI003D9715F9